MAIKQLSIYVENKPGEMAKVVRAISGAGINIRAMSLADTKDFGVLRLIVSDPDKMKEILAEDTIVTTTQVIAVEMDDKEGALYNVLRVLEENNINVEYMYAFTGTVPNKAYVVLRVDDLAEAESILTAKGIPMLTEESMTNVLL